MSIPLTNQDLTTIVDAVVRGLEQRGYVKLSAASSPAPVAAANARSLQIKLAAYQGCRSYIPAMQKAKHSQLVQTIEQELKAANAAPVRIEAVGISNLPLNEEIFYLESQLQCLRETNAPTEKRTQVASRLADLHGRK